MLLLCELLLLLQLSDACVALFYFKDHMTVRRNRLLVNKTNRCTEFQFYWYYYSTCFGQPFCPSSGVLSYTQDLVIFDAAPGSSKRSQLHKMYQSRCTAKNS